MLVLGAGCSDEAEPAKDDQALVVVLPRDAEELDPRFVGDPYGLKVSRLIFASLVRIDPETLEPVPDLAEGIEQETPTRFRVRLRPGLRFADGSTLDATDVMATFRSVVDPELGSRYRATYQRIARMSAPDPRTVIFELTAPHATFLTDLELPVLRAEDAHHKIALPGGPPPVGAGPYRLVARSAGHLHLRANPFWYAGRPRYPDVRMLVVQDDNTRALRMLAGKGDLALQAIPPLLVPLFEKDARFEVRSVPGIATTYLGVNTEAGPLADVRVRRAIAHALDRRALVRAKYGGRAHLARGLVPPGHWAYDPDVPTYDYDPEASRALLDAAGLPDPDGDGPAPRLRLTLRASSDRFRDSVARAMAAMLRRVGIAVDVRPSEMATLIADLGRGRFELALMEIPEVIEPHVLSWFFASDRIPSDGRSGANRWRYRSAVVDQAFEEGRRTSDRAARRAAYRVVQAHLAADLPVIPLWHEDVVAITDARARGFAVPRDGRLDPLAR